MPAFGAIVSAAVLYQTIREKPNRPKNKKHSRTQRTKNEGKNAKENPFHFMHNTWMHWEEQVYKCKHAIRDADFGDISYNIIHKESQRKRNSHHSVMLITMGKLPGKFIHFALLSYPTIRVYLYAAQTISHTELERKNEELNHMKCRVILITTDRHE